MDIRDYSPEMKALLVSSLEDKIVTYRKLISEAQSMINDAKGLSSSQNEVVYKTNRAGRKPKDGGWIEKIKTVLQNSNEPLTSRQILDKMIEIYPDLSSQDNVMGSLSPALGGAYDDGILLRHKKDGEFAKFELANKNVIDFKNAINE